MVHLSSKSYAVHNQKPHLRDRWKHNYQGSKLAMVLILTNVLTLLVLGLLFWVHYTIRVIDWTSTKEFSEVLKNLIEVIAITVGGCWAYYRFIKGRVVKSRLELTVDGRLKLIDGRYYLITTGKITNVGTSDFRIREEGANLRISTYPSYIDKGIYTPKENHHGTFSIFPQDKLLEPGEAIQNERITTVDYDFVVVGIQMFVDSEVRRWYTSCIVEKPVLELRNEP